MIEKLMPAEVVCMEAFDDPPDAALYPEEEVVISRAVETRRRKFRHAPALCAASATGARNTSGGAAARDRGMPQWPPGAVGSMTHCEGYRAAAVARSRDLLAIGIDAEPHDMLSPDVLDYVARESEQATT